ncbi:MAG: hypothetical protein KF869_02675 [Phycisphaeraceae bacterium]|nr:hypothetical protein [Phycisphaeraceae bacterium]
MTYTLLGETLHETADRARKYFAHTYGAKSFICEKPSSDSLPLAPTWAARLGNGYGLYINVQSTPYMPTLSDVVSIGVNNGLPIKLWVAVNHDAPKLTFTEDLRRASDLGIGVVQFDEQGKAKEWNRAIPLSLYALRKTDPARVPKLRKEELRNAESTFLSGSPPDGCQAICQELEAVTRAFSEYTYKNGCWINPVGAKPLADRFFRRDSWATMLELLDQRVDVKSTRKKCQAFTKSKVAAARGYTDWRNSLSHKPRNVRELRDRDTRLRTMFEATRDLLLEWYEIVKPIKIV